MATIGTTTHADPFIYPSQVYMDRGGSQSHFYAIARTGSTTFQLYRSTDGGTTWATAGSAVTRTGLQELGGIVASPDNFVYLVYRVNESSFDKVYVRRFAMATLVWEAEQLSSALANGGVAGAVTTGMTFYPVLFPDGWVKVVLALGTQQGAVQGVTVGGAYYSPAGVFTSTNVFLLGTRIWLPTTGTGRITPAMSVEHTGDYHAWATPHLWLAWGRTELYLVKLAAGGYRQWTGPLTPVTVGSGFAAQDAVAGRWDGSRWLMCMPNPASGLTDTVVLYERDRANSITTARVTPAHPTGVIRNCMVAYSPDSWKKVTRIYAVGTSTTVLYYVDFDRNSGTWSSWAQVSATAVLGTTGNNWGVRPGITYDAKFSVYRAASGSPNTLTHDMQTIAFAPSVPTWATTDGQAADVAQSLLLDWVFTDLDPGDAQSAYALSRQIGAGALAYFRASDSTWQATEQKNTSGTTSRTLASGWGAGSDATHVYKVKVWDAADTASQYSAPLAVVASVLVDPTVTAPTPAQVLTGDSVTVTWTVSEQSAFRVVLSITAGAQLHDSGWVAGAALTYTPPISLANGGAYTVTLQTRNLEGLLSTVVTRNVTVSFLAPDTPTLVATAVPASGYITVAVTNPAPTGGRPTVGSNDIYRRPVGDSTDGLRVAAGVANSGSYNDWQAVSGVAYEYRVLAKGTNGTSGFGAWTT